jgi:predicted double-glycine peptidase
MRDELIGQKLKKLGILNEDQISNTINIQNSTGKKFGDILIENNLIKEEFLEDIVEAIAGNKFAIKRLESKKFGELLIDLHYVDEETLDKVLKEQAGGHSPNSFYKKIGFLLIEKGLVASEKITKAFVIQKRLANIAMIGFFLTSCGSPRVPLQSNIGIVQDYTASSIAQVLKESPIGSVNYYQDGTIAISNIPFFKQGDDNTCGQAVMASILNYWGVNVSYQKVVNESNSGNFATDVPAVTRYLNKKGLFAQDYRLATMSFIKDRIQKGRPVIILLDFGKISFEHYVIVTGFNEQRREFIILDPVEGPNIRMSYDSVEAMWQNVSLKKLGIFGDKYNKIAYDVYLPNTSIGTNF